MNDLQKEVRKLHKKSPEVCARTYALTVAVCNTLLAISGQMFDKKRSPFQACLIQSITASGLIALAAYYTSKQILPKTAKEAKIFVIRAAFSAVLGLCFRASSMLLPTQVFIVLLNMNVVYASIIEPLKQGMRPSFKSASMVLLSFLTITLLAFPQWVGFKASYPIRRDMTSLEVLGFGLVTLYALGNVLLSIFYSRAKESMTPFQESFSASIGLAVVSGVCSRLWPAPAISSKDYYLGVACGLIVCVSYLGWYLASKFAKSISRISMVLNLEVVFTFLVDILFVSQNFVFCHCLGASVLYVAQATLARSRREQEEEDSVRSESSEAGDLNIEVELQEESGSSLGFELDTFVEDLGDFDEVLNDPYFPGDGDEYHQVKGGVEKFRFSALSTKDNSPELQKKVEAGDLVISPRLCRLEHRCGNTEFDI